MQENFHIRYSCINIHIAQLIYIRWKVSLILYHVHAHIHREIYSLIKAFPLAHGTYIREREREIEFKKEYLDLRNDYSYAKRRELLTLLPFASFSRDKEFRPRYPRLSSRRHLFHSFLVLRQLGNNAAILAKNCVTLKGDRRQSVNAKSLRKPINAW